MPERALSVEPADVLRYRARATHLDRKLPAGNAGSLATAAWGGLQDSIPRSGVISLHARVDGVRPDAWEAPSLVQIWFRGADFLVPRADVGIFTLGSYPRDPERGRQLEAIADEVHHLTGGRMTPVRELPSDLGGRPFAIRTSAMTGRAHIRWDASNIWVIPVERPSIDVEDARRELARRFLHWHGPATARRFAQWAGVEPRDAAETWRSIEGELGAVTVDGVTEARFVLAADLDALRGARPIEGVRLLPMDDPFTKHDHELLLADEALHARALPGSGRSPGYIPGAVLVDGEIVGGWQRQQRKVTLHPFRGRRLGAATHAAIEAEAVAFPIAGSSPPSVAWDPV